MINLIEIQFIVNIIIQIQIILCKTDLSMQMNSWFSNDYSTLAGKLKKIWYSSLRQIKADIIIFKFCMLNIQKGGRVPPMPPPKSVPAIFINYSFFYCVRKLYLAQYIFLVCLAVFQYKRDEI